MTTRRLKIVMLCWAVLAIADVLFDRLLVSLIFGGVTCVLGVLVLTAASAISAPERKSSKTVGILFLVLGTFFILLEAFNRFIIHR